MRRHLAAGLLLLVTACSGGGDPTTELRQAIEATFADSFAFTVQIDADAEALAALGEAAGQAAAFLSSARLSGVRDGEDLSIALSVLGVDLFEARTLGNDRTYLRTGLGDLAGMIGAPVDPSQVEAELERARVPAELRGVLTTALTGGWIGIQGDLRAVAEVFGTPVDGPAPAEVAAAAREEFGDLPTALERFLTVTDTSEADGTRTYRVELHARDLLDALSRFTQRLDPAAQTPTDLSGVPELVAGAIDARDGRVEAIRFDIAAAARAVGGDVPGRLELVIRLSDHGRVAPIEAPPDALEVPAAQFADAMRALLELLGS